MPKKLIRIQALGLSERRHGQDYINVFFSKMPYILNNYNFVISDNPNFILYDRKFPKGSKAVKIYYSHEGRPPDLARSDWAFGCDYEDTIQSSRYMRQPNYVRLGAGVNLIKHKVNVNDIIRRKTKFCNFIYHHNVPQRVAIFKALSKYKRIDSPGEVCQNMSAIGGCATAHASRGRAGRVYQDKLQFISPYKFTIAFENRFYPGYTSEKIYHPMLVNSIPIYWGNRYIGRDFNTKSFVNAHECPHSTNRLTAQMIDYVVSRIIAIDKNDDLYAKMLLEPWYPKNKLTKYVQPNTILSRFKQIFG